MLSQNNSFCGTYLIWMYLDIILNALVGGLHLFDQKDDRFSPCRRGRIVNQYDLPQSFFAPDHSTIVKWADCYLPGEWSERLMSREAGEERRSRGVRFAGVYGLAGSP